VTGFDYYLFVSLPGFDYLGLIDCFSTLPLAPYIRDSYVSLFIVNVANHHDFLNALDEEL
jgi:hypothetical protein